MSYTPEEIIELTAIKVQEVVCPKIENFMDNVAKEVHSMHLEMKQNREFDSAIIAQFNDLKSDVVALGATKEKVDKLHTLFAENGYMEKFDKLCGDWNNYLLKDRFLTCPFREQKESKIKSTTMFVSIGAAVISFLTLASKLVGLW